MITTLDLFAGIGGFALGLEATGFFRTTCFVEKEPYCQAVLRHHWPDVPVLGDIRDVRREDLPDPNPGLICGGFPCQPFSHAGKQRAQDDPRHLWPEMLRLIRECRPDWVIGENVTGLIKLGLDEVLSDLEGEGYATRTFNIPACAVGAPHIRQRLWVVAHAHSESEPDGDAGQRQLGFGFMADADSDDGGREGSSKSLGRETRLEHSGCGTQRDMADAKSAGSQARGRDGMGTANRSRRNKGQSARTSSKTDVADAKHAGYTERVQPETTGYGSGHRRPEDWWAVEPDVGRVAHGIPARVAQLRALGNAIVPQIAQEIGNAIKGTY
jgi:DNA (cytosine-5)-methyltransferase 1